jgi:hypothetical protein
LSLLLPLSKKAHDRDIAKYIEPLNEIIYHRARNFESFKGKVFSALSAVVLSKYLRILINWQKLKGNPASINLQILRIQFRR